MGKKLVRYEEFDGFKMEFVFDGDFSFGHCVQRGWMLNPTTKRSYVAVVRVVVAGC